MFSFFNKESGAHNPELDPIERQKANISLLEEQLKHAEKELQDSQMGQHYDIPDSGPTHEEGKVAVFKKQIEEAKARLAELSGEDDSETEESYKEAA